MVFSIFSLAVLGSALLQPVLAAPAIELPTFERPSPVEKRQVPNPVEVIDTLITEAAIDISQILAASNIISELSMIQPTATPTNVEQALSSLSAAYAQATPNNFIDAAALVIENSLNPTNIPSLLQALNSFGGINNDNNPNNPAPSTTIYPKKLPCDAPYSVSEAELRRQIFIPSTFTYGQKPPVILFPGTGGRGGQNFMGNFEVLLADVDYADLVWVNPTNFLLTDAQYNAEMAAYAINYISSISQNKNVSIIAWSQGNINIQWATKYWPSTRNVLSDHIAISPDYHGTTNEYIIDPENSIAYSPSVEQQAYNSNFIKALRSFGGDSAYVPTTNIYSGTYDEIVEPQQGANASAILLDARNVGVTNAQVQVVCGADSPAGFFQTHESMLANSLSFALAVDALTHDGPGQISRIDLNSVCQNAIAPGLSFEDFLETEQAILIAGLEVLSFFQATNVEPAISAYALTSPTVCATSTATTLATKTTKTKTSATKTLTPKTTTTKASSTKTTTPNTSTSATKTSTTTKTATKSSSTSKTATNTPTKTSTKSSTKAVTTSPATTPAATTSSAGGGLLGITVGLPLGPVSLSLTL